MLTRNLMPSTRSTTDSKTNSDEEGKVPSSAGDNSLSNYDFSKMDFSSKFGDEQNTDDKTNDISVRTNLALARKTPTVAYSMNR